MSAISADITEPARPEKRSRLYWALSDARILIWRSVSHIIKNFDQLLSAALMPIMFYLLFRYVFGGAIETGGTTYVNYLMAGILVQMAAFGATYTAIEVATDLQRGIIDRFRSMPMLSSAVLVGHTMADLIRNSVSTVIVVLVGLATGFRPTASFTDWVLIFGILLIFTYALSWLMAIIGLLAKTIEAVQWITFVLIFPLTFASSAFAPTANMPGALRAFAENQPVNHVIEAIRALLVGTPIGNHGWWALGWSIAILVISIPFAAFLFRRHTSH